MYIDAKTGLMYKDEEEFLLNELSKVEEIITVEDTGRELFRDMGKYREVVDKELRSIIDEESSYIVSYKVSEGRIEGELTIDLSAKNGQELTVFISDVDESVYTDESWEDYDGYYSKDSISLIDLKGYIKCMNKEYRKVEKDLKLKGYKINGVRIGNNSNKGNFIQNNRYSSSPNPTILEDNIFDMDIIEESTGKVYKYYHELFEDDKNELLFKIINNKEYVNQVLKCATLISYRGLKNIYTEDEINEMVIDIGTEMNMAMSEYIPYLVERPINNKRYYISIFNILMNIEGEEIEFSYTKG